MSSTLTVLGSSGAWPEPGRACSGYLLSHGGVRIVLDLGTGTASRLFTLLGADPPDAVVITHAHPDHAIDLHALFRSRLYTRPRPSTPVPAATPPPASDPKSAPTSPPASVPESAGASAIPSAPVSTGTPPVASGPHDAAASPIASGADSTATSPTAQATGSAVTPPAAAASSTTRAPSTVGPARPARIPVFAADGVAELMAAIDPPDVDDLPSVFDFRKLPAGPYRIGPFRLESMSLPHYVPNAGVRLIAPGLTVAYTGDTGPSPALADLARDADLFIADCTDRPPLNLTADQAATAAAEGGARRLLLTHFWPGADRDACRARAARRYPGDILLADEAMHIDLDS